ncbi:MAG: lipid-A-disaccharide synthase [Duncaniella sp.]|nr:lipid-A-disaccharide synthase [Duncaniella sp.]
MKYFFSAGEASGDIHAAGVIECLRRLDPEAKILFLGGDAMSAATGSRPLIHIDRMAYMGFVNVALHIGDVLGNMRIARSAMRVFRPDLFVAVDYPGFNLKMVSYANALGIPTAWYIAPKLWAWKEYRLKTMKKVVDKTLSILPFEPEWFSGHGMKVDYVGNPSVEEVERTLSRMPRREEWLEKHGLDNRPILALIPGSRVGEIKDNLPVMDQVGRLHHDMQVVVAGAPSVDRALYRRFTSFKIITGETLTLMAMARAALVTSGTASLECALAGTPQVVLYRSIGLKVAHNAFEHILKIPYVSLPNLIGGKIDAETRRRVDARADATGVRSAIVPEMLMHHCNAEEVDAQLRPLLSDSKERDAQLAGYALVRARLATKTPAAENAAASIYELAKKMREQKKS